MTKEPKINPIPGTLGYTEMEFKRMKGSHDPHLTKIAIDLEKKALAKQEGGDHYKDMPIQVVEFCQLNELNYCEANVVKYVCRHKKKNGKEDLLKAKHYIDLLLQLEYDGD